MLLKRTNIRMLQHLFMPYSLVTSLICYALEDNMQYCILHITRRKIANALKVIQQL